MSKLFNLKKLFTIAETAKRLSSVFDEDVTEADVLQLVFDGHLQLSVNFPSETCAERQVQISMDYRKNAADLPLTYDGKVKQYHQASRGNDDMAKIIGTWDLPLIHSEYKLIKDKWQSLLNIPVLSNVEDEVAIAVSGSDGTILILAMKYSEYLAKYTTEQEIGEWKASEKGIGWSEELEPEWTSAREFPKDSYFVVRKDALTKFEASIHGKSAAIENPMVISERNNLLKQIAALSLALAEKSNRYKRGDKPNVSQIADATIDTLDALPDINPGGIGKSSFRDSIKAGLDLLTMTKQ